MKWHIALAALALVQPSAARGLKTPRRTGAEAALDAQIDGLEVENSGLKEKNRHLEAMMRVARKEVHRLDLFAKSRNLRHDNTTVDDGSDDAERYLIEKLRKELDKAKAERNSLAQTLKKLLAKNSTKIYKTKADKAIEAEHALEKRFGQERANLSAQVKEAQLLVGRFGQERANLSAQIKEAKANFEDSKEMLKTLQEENLDLKKSINALQAQFAKSEQKTHDLITDKVNLVETMHSLMNDAEKARKELQVETKKEQEEAKEVAALKAQLANVTSGRKMQKGVADARKPSTKANAMPALKMHHEESMAYQSAKMKDINRYIDRANDMVGNVVADEVTAAPKQVTSPPAAVHFGKETDWATVSKKVESLKKEEDAFERNKVHKGLPDNPEDVEEAAEMTHQSKGLSKWLGFKAKPAEGAISTDANGLSPIDALDPDAVKQEKAAQAKKAKEDADDGGDGIEQLLSQAKDQLNEMNRAEE